MEMALIGKAGLIADVGDRILARKRVFAYSMRAMLIKLAGVRPVSCFTARITVSLRSALSWASLSSDGDAGRSIARR